MVRLDLEPGGLAVLRFAAPYLAQDEGDYLSALERLAALDGPFMLLTLFSGGRALSQAGERAQALWFKRNRAGMDARCRGCAMVRPEAGEEMAAVFRRLWSFPILATPDEARARAFLADLAAEARP